MAAEFANTRSFLTRISKPVRADIVVETAMLNIKSSVRSEIIRICRPDGVGDLFGFGFYNDAAPMALDWRAHGRRPVSGALLQRQKHLQKRTKLTKQEISSFPSPARDLSELPSVRLPTGAPFGLAGKEFLHGGGMGNGSFTGLITLHYSRSPRIARLASKRKDKRGRRCCSAMIISKKTSVHSSESGFSQIARIVAICAGRSRKLVACCSETISQLTGRAQSSTAK